jgi:hypothetical protein
LRFSSTIAAALIAAVTTAHAEPVKLQWGGQQSTAKNQDADSNTALRFVKPSVGGSSIAVNKTADIAAPKATKRIAITGHASPSKATAKKANGNKIQLAAYEEVDAPRLTSGREVETETRSVVVHPGDSANENSRESSAMSAADGFRSAQLPSEQGTPGGKSNKVEDGLRSPFADNQEEPPQPNPLPMPPEGTTQAPTAEEQNARTELQLQQQPAGAGLPPAAGPSTGQFQPILPSGPGPDQSPPTPPGAEEGTIQVEGERAKASCEESLKNLRAYTVDKVQLDISIRGTEGEDYPFECSIDDGTMHAGRCWDQVTYTWKASALCHKPLYFEDEQLERYGHSFSPCFQPFVSGAHFFTRLPVLPYCMGVEPPCECVYALGHYRPGNCAPYMCNPIPLSLRGALFEAGAVTGTAAILP